MIKWKFFINDARFYLFKKADKIRLAGFRRHRTASKFVIVFDGVQLTVEKMGGLDQDLIMIRLWKTSRYEGAAKAAYLKKLP